MTTTLTDFKRSEQLPLDLVLADHVVEAIQDPGRERKPRARLTKSDAVSAEIVTQYPGEHVEPRRW